MLNVYLRPRTISARNAIVYHTLITVRLLLFFLPCNQLSGGKETNRASLSLLSIGFINIGFAFLIIVSTEDFDRWVSYGFLLFCDESL